MSSIRQSARGAASCRGSVRAGSGVRVCGQSGGAVRFVILPRHRRAATGAGRS